MMLKAFSGSILVTVVGLSMAFALGFESGGMKAALSALFLCSILAVLEISLSFDNAVVNASVLNQMTEKWRKRFLTWGILIAVFGMRLVLPLGIVAVMAEISPWAALMMAIDQPQKYAELMHSIHGSVAAFGGMFLFLVGIEYFVNEERDKHWLRWIERPLARMGRVKSIEVILALSLLSTMAMNLEVSHRLSFVLSGVAGIITFLLVDSLEALLGGGSIGKKPDAKSGSVSEADLHRASLGMFLYLEVLDASFSFDGVIGAFALTQNLFYIAIGLGIGAMFVRSLTVLLVENHALARFQYLEHGAFWAILSLAGLMFLGVFMPVPEYITGLVGALLIGASMWSSVRVAKS